ncbi:hypothetical protein GYMLUDRAFT_560367 [Collybiopsis luxurians FD-317 M1]|uniref:Uncharacterized protein n=1 Tax=Collybiopsis luxurians FD-317 M1 TaxID=944289 RepID=A0A0D0CZI9_9AGAR|nr:hypothetical protein GYMLUDRAFT_560367 [Collybiopsis luxurians FD-317 M1]
MPSLSSHRCIGPSFLRSRSFLFLCIPNSPLLHILNSLLLHILNSLLLHILDLLQPLVKSINLTSITGALE